MNIYYFKHSLLQRDKKHNIVGFSTNTYEIISSDTQDAYRRVPPSSFLQKVTSSEGDVIYDFTKRIDQVPSCVRIREKIGDSGRNSLSKTEYSEAVFSGLIR
tara:strand:+ start:685 stop:990 length:306 start_codon:yes stop_codon:yes gene_type:complete